MAWMISAAKQENKFPPEEGNYWSPILAGSLTFMTRNGRVAKNEILYFHECRPARAHSAVVQTSSCLDLHEDTLAPPSLPVKTTTPVTMTAAHEIPRMASSTFSSPVLLFSQPFLARRISFMRKSNEHLIDCDNLPSTRIHSGPQEIASSSTVPGV